MDPVVNIYGGAAEHAGRSGNDRPVRSIHILHADLSYVDEEMDLAEDIQ